MPTLTQKSAILRSNSPLDRGAFLGAISAWLSGQCTDEDVKYAQFLDLKNLDQLFTIVFSPEAVEEFDIPAEMATIDVVAIILELLQERIGETMSQEITIKVTEATQGLTPLPATVGEDDEPALSAEQIQALADQINNAIEVDGPDQETVEQWGRDGVATALADAMAEIHRLRDELQSLATTTPGSPDALISTPADIAILAPSLFDPVAHLPAANAVQGVAVPGGEVKTLLPPNATRSEKALEIVMAERLVGIENPIYALWNVNTCPEHLLPWLAWAFSVEVWDHSWDVTVKRNMIRNSLAIHRIKGTKHAIELALQTLGMRIDLHEWFELDEHGQQYGPPHTFLIDVIAGDVFDAGFAADAELHALISELIQTVKPVRAHFTLRVGEARTHTVTYATGHRGRIKSERSHNPLVAPERKAVALEMVTGHRATAAGRHTHTPAVPAEAKAITLAVHAGFRARVTDRRASTFQYEEVA